MIEIDARIMDFFTAFILGMYAGGMVVFIFFVPKRRDLAEPTWVDPVEDAEAKQLTAAPDPVDPADFWKPDGWRPDEPEDEQA